MIPIEIRQLDTGEYLATSKLLKGLIAQGRSIAETLEIAQDVARKLIESYQDHGDPLPSKIQKQLKKKSKIAHLQVPVMVHA